MLNRVILIILVQISFLSIAIGQLSPGKLYKGHSDLEGLSNCTKCHDFGKKVSDKKCLDCHKEIKTLIDQKRGYHYSREVRNKDCAACHSDHHGRDFQIIRFDEDNFDHDLSGYKLKGEHKRIDCRECHKPDYITDRDLRKDKDTYLGLDDECLSCHDDYHRGELSDNCLDCHNFNKFTEVDKFDHDKSDYPLRGKHKNVDCEKCHKIEGQGDNKYQKFKNIPFNSCADCHDDVHKGSLGTKCNSCHTEMSFGINVVKRKFNHNKNTQYKLKGKHRRIGCYECHSPDKPKTTLFSDFKNYADFDCDKCHDDAHEGKFGTDCSSCHTEKSFNKIKLTGNFNHNVTDFPLLGKHKKVDCKECHKTKLLDPVAHANCTDCHKDYHEGEIKHGNEVTDCKECHTEKGFDDFDYDIEKHKNTDFPLRGAHEATPCFACHQVDGQQKWKFQSLGKDCVDCHENIHKDELDTKYYPEENCRKCHDENKWNNINSFDHNNTAFILEGKHKEVKCIDCHKPDKESVKVKFKGIPLSCDKCHTDEHYGQFANSGKTDCGTCHTPDNWEASKFDHNTARFKLDGAHKDLACDKCHKEELHDGKNYTKRKQVCKKSSTYNFKIISHQ